jgi:pyridoxal/pyridoxine/pyridoxamine kinase
VVTGSGAWTVTTPRLTLAAMGAGDALAALFFGRHLDCGNAADALTGAVLSVFVVIDATSAAGARSCCWWPIRTRSPRRPVGFAPSGFPVRRRDGRHSAGAGKTIG